MPVYFCHYTNERNYNSITAGTPNFLSSQPNKGCQYQHEEGFWVILAGPNALFGDNDIGGKYGINSRWGHWFVFQDLHLLKSDTHPITLHWQTNRWSFVVTPGTTSNLQHHLVGHGEYEQTPATPIRAVVDMQDTIFSKKTASSWLKNIGNKCGKAKSIGSKKKH